MGGSSPWGEWDRNCPNHSPHPGCHSVTATETRSSCGAEFLDLWAWKAIRLSSYMQKEWHACRRRIRNRWETDLRPPAVLGYCILLYFHLLSFTLMELFIHVRKVRMVKWTLFTHLRRLSTFCLVILPSNPSLLASVFFRQLWATLTFYLSLLRVTISYVRAF